MPRVLISGQIDEAGMAVLRARPGLVIEEMVNSRPEDFLARLPEADALLLRIAFLPGEAIVNANRLKVVSRYGVGYDNVPLEALTAKGVAVTVVGPVHTDTVAEHAFFLERGQVRFDGRTAELLGRDDLLRSVFLDPAAGGGD